VLIWASPAFVGQQTSQNIGANISLGFGQSACNASLLDRRQTMSKNILVAWWAGFAAYPCHLLEHSG